MIDGSILISEKTIPCDLCHMQKMMPTIQGDLIVLYSNGILKIDDLKTMDVLDIETTNDGRVFLLTKDGVSDIEGKITHPIAVNPFAQFLHRPDIILEPPNVHIVCIEQKD